MSVFFCAVTDAVALLRLRLYIHLFQFFPSIRFIFNIMNGWMAKSVSSKLKYTHTHTHKYHIDNALRQSARRLKQNHSISIMFEQIYRIKFLLFSVFFFISFSNAIRIVSSSIYVKFEERFASFSYGFICVKIKHAHAYKHTHTRYIYIDK